MLGPASWFRVLSHRHLTAGAAIFSYYGHSVLTSPSELPPTCDVMYNAHVHVRHLYGLAVPLPRES